MGLWAWTLNIRSTVSKLDYPWYTHAILAAWEVGCFILDSGQGRNTLVTPCTRGTRTSRHRNLFRYKSISLTVSLVAHLSFVFLSTNLPWYRITCSPSRLCFYWPCQSTRFIFGIVEVDMHISIRHCGTAVRRYNASSPQWTTKAVLT